MQLGNGGKKTNHGPPEELQRKREHQDESWLLTGGEEFRDHEESRPGRHLYHVRGWDNRRGTEEKCSPSHRDVC